jgi:hypothetical protein
VTIHHRQPHDRSTLPQETVHCDFARCARTFLPRTWLGPALSVAPPDYGRIEVVFLLVDGALAHRRTSGRSFRRARSDLLSSRAQPRAPRARFAELVFGGCHFFVISPL